MIGYFSTLANPLRTGEAGKGDRAWEGGRHKFMEVYFDINCKIRGMS